MLYCVRFATLTSWPDASITLAGALRLSVSAVRPECPAPTRSPAESPARRPFLPANYGRSRARPAGRPIRPPRRTGPAPGPALAPIGSSATPANVCPGFQVAHWSARVLPGSLKKKKKFYGRMEGAGAAPGKGRAGATAAGGREGRRAGCAAEPGPRVPCSVLGRRHDGEWPRLEPSEAGNRVPGQLGPDLPPWFPALLPPRSPCCGGQ